MRKPNKTNSKLSVIDKQIRKLTINDMKLEGTNNMFLNFQKPITNLLNTSSLCY